MGQSHAYPGLRRGSSTRSVVPVPTNNGAEPEFDSVAPLVRIRSSQSSAAQNGPLNASASFYSNSTSSLSIPSNVTETGSCSTSRLQAPLAPIKVDPIDILLSIAGVMCDMTMQLNAQFYVSPANGSVNRYFQSDVESRPFLDLVSMVDRSRVEATLKNLPLTRAKLQSATLLCDHGVGTIEGKLLMMPAMNSSNDPIYIIGVRTQNLQGLCSTSASPSDECDDDIDMISTSVSCRFTSPYASETSPTSGRQLRPLAASSKLASEISAKHKARKSCSSASSEKPESIATFNSSIVSSANKESPHRASLMTVSWSALSSNVGSKLFSGASSARQRHSRSIKSVPSSGNSTILTTSSSGFSSDLSWRSRSLFTKPSVGTQTEISNLEEVEKVEAGMQTESTHVPSTLVARPPSGLTAPQSPSKKQRCPSDTSTTNSSLSSWSRRSRRSSTDGRLRERRSSTSSKDSSGLAIRHFRETPMNTIMFHLDTFTEHLNVHTGVLACCTWHSTVRQVSVALTGLAEQPCRGITWRPSCGWQCKDCLSLNDAEDGDCGVCCGDRDQD